MEESRKMKCPKCGKEQPRADVCAVCGFGVKAHFAQAAAEARKRREVTCPKCRLVQPIRPICARCKFDIREYYNRRREQEAARRAAQKAAAPPAPAAASASVGGGGGDLLSFEELFKAAWGVFKRRVVTVLLVMVLATVLALAASAVLPLAGVLLALALPGGKGVIIGIAALGASIVFLVAVGWAGAAITHAVADERVTMGVAFKNGWVHAWAFIWLYCLVGYLYPGAYMLFLVPGLVFTVWFGFAQYIVVSQDVRGTDALALSRAYVRGRFWDVFLRLFAVWFVAALIGVVPLVGPLISFVFMPYPMLYTYLLYEDLRRVRGAVEPPYATKGEKAAWFGVATLGYVIVVVAIVVAVGGAIWGMMGNLSSVLGKGEFKMPDIPGIQEGFVPGDGGEPSTSLPPGTLRPYEYEKLVGTWEATGLRDSGDWTFVFSPGYTMEARGPNDIWFRAETAVYMDVGARPQEDFIRVPPGASIMDFTIQAGSEPRYIGQVSLGAFKFELEKMTLCATEPGVLDRFESFEPTNKVACFEMTKTGGGPPLQPQPEAAMGQPEVGPGDAGGPALTGTARAVKDGAPVAYELATGFFSDTRFEDPRRATVEFRTAGAEKFSNPERIEITLDATRRGIHFLDGPAIDAALFDHSAIAIGEDTPTGIIASMRFIAEGGQVFPPKDLCFITVKTAWSGAPGSVFAGSVSSCTMHSAGIDRVINSMDFEVRVP